MIKKGRTRFKFHPIYIVIHRKLCLHLKNFIKLSNVLMGAL